MIYYPQNKKVKPTSIEIVGYQGCPNCDQIKAKAPVYSNIYGIEAYLTNRADTDTGVGQLTNDNFPFVIIKGDNDEVLWEKYGATIEDVDKALLTLTEQNQVTISGEYSTPSDAPWTREDKLRFVGIILTVLAIAITLYQLTK